MIGTTRMFVVRRSVVSKYFIVGALIPLVLASLPKRLAPRDGQTGRICELCHRHGKSVKAS